MDSERSRWSLWLTPIILVIAISTALIVIGRLGDLSLMAESPSVMFRNWIFVEDAEVARNVILAVLEILAGIFAISITVVAIIVQLSATRYTSRVVDLFLADPFNILIFFIYVVPLVYGFWLSNVLTAGENAQISVGVFMILATFSTILVIPYFKFVFYFLQPRHIIETIERSIEKSLTMAIHQPEHLVKARREVSNSIRQLSDISLSSIAQSDIVLALQCVNSIKQVAVYYQAIKHQLPEDWFEIDRNHIVGLSEDMWQEMVQSHTWFELEVFKQYEITFTSSLRKVRDINSYVARSMREIAEVAFQCDREETLELLIKGLNTLIMYSLSERDIRSAVHVLYQYRLLGESLLIRPDLMEKIGNHLKYYGHNSQRRRIFFVLDAVAYDLRGLIERAFESYPKSADVLLDIFLQLDQAAETKEDATFLRGIRKSQALLAGFFIRAKRLDLAKRIHDDMSQETPEFLQRVRKDLFSVQTRDFWEIEDRGVSFYYVEEDQRESVDTFFSWLLGERPLPKEIAQSA